jgi:hypothetical protein
VLDPTLLSPAPVIEAAMTAAGFHLAVADNGHVEPGIWVRASDITGAFGEPEAVLVRLP